MGSLNSPGAARRRKPASKLALWASPTQSSGRNPRKSGITCSTVRLPLSMAGVMPVMRTMISGSGTPGSTSSLKRPAISPSRQTTAPISMIRSR